MRDAWAASACAWLWIWFCHSLFTTTDVGASCGMGRFGPATASTSRLSKPETKQIQKEEEPTQRVYCVPAGALPEVEPRAHVADRRERHARREARRRTPPRRVVHRGLVVHAPDREECAQQRAAHCLGFLVERPVDEVARVVEAERAVLIAVRKGGAEMDEGTYEFGCLISWNVCMSSRAGKEYTRASRVSIIATSPCAPENIEYQL